MFCFISHHLLIHAGSGVTTDIWTSYAGIIMAISVIPFLIVQLPQILHITNGRHLTVLISLLVSASLLIAYCMYQVSSYFIFHLIEEEINKLWRVATKITLLVSSFFKILRISQDFILYFSYRCSSPGFKRGGLLLLSISILCQESWRI